MYGAKAHFSELIERAQSGRATVITKRGHAVAKIVPAKEPVWDRSAVLDEAEALRKKLKIKGRFKTADLIAAGHLQWPSCLTHPLSLGISELRNLANRFGLTAYDHRFRHRW